MTDYEGREAGAELDRLLNDPVERAKGIAIFILIAVICGLLGLLAKALFESF